MQTSNHARPVVIIVIVIIIIIVVVVVNIIIKHSCLGLLQTPQNQRPSILPKLHFPLGSHFKIVFGIMSELMSQHVLSNFFYLYEFCCL
jgi:hypothetical protein